MAGADVDGSEGDMQAPRPGANNIDFDDLVAARARVMPPRTRSAGCGMRMRGRSVASTEVQCHSPASRSCDKDLIPPESDELTSGDVQAITSDVAGQVESIGIADRRRANLKNGR